MSKLVVMDAIAIANVHEQADADLHQRHIDVQVAAITSRQKNEITQGRLAKKKHKSLNGKPKRSKSIYRGLGVEDLIIPSDAPGG